jgi:cytoskeleton protein RodZ
MQSEANQTDQETFGSYLRAFRETQALSVEAIAQRTKIAVHCLKALEADNLAQLPPTAYVKSFIRAYADAVGANPDVALNLYRACLDRRAYTRKRQIRRQAKLATLRRVLMAIGLVTSILLLVRYTNLFPGPQAPESPAAGPLVETQATVGEGNAARPPVAPATEKLKLKVVAVEKTWLKIIVDGQNARSYELKPEERLELEGTTSFNLMIGNATGLRIYLNENPVKIYGSSGQVVSLKIP